MSKETDTSECVRDDYDKFLLGEFCYACGENVSDNDLPCPFCAVMEDK